MRELLSGAAEAVLDLVFPPSLYCVCCGNIIDRSRSYSLCDHCMSRIKWTLEEKSTPEGMRIVTCCEYGIYERSLIFALKYNGKRNVARNIAEIMADRWGSREEPGTCPQSEDPVIVPVPVHETKRRSRGFDQMDLISKHFAAKTGIPRLCCLERIKETRPMRGLGPEERKANVAGSFRLRPGVGREDLAGKKVILLDDFCTTGSTADACREALEEAGPVEVILFTFAARFDRMGEGFPEEDGLQTGLGI